MSDSRRTTKSLLPFKSVCYTFASEGGGMRIAESEGSKLVALDRNRRPIFGNLGSSPVWAKHTVVYGMLALIIAFSILLAGCSSKKNQNAAKDAIEKGLWHDSVLLSIYIGRVSQKCANQINLSGGTDLTAFFKFRALQKGGLISITPDGPGFWKVDPVDAKLKLMESKKAPSYQEDGCAYRVLAFPIASKSVVEIANMREITDQKTEVEFTWKWALTPYGTKLVDGLTPQELAQISADFRNYNPRLRPDPTFVVVDMTQSGTPRPGKMTLKKSGDGWVMDQ